MDYNPFFKKFPVIFLQNIHEMTLIVFPNDPQILHSHWELGTHRHKPFLQVRKNLKDYLF